MVTCSICKQIKPKSEFYKRKDLSSSSGIASHCKACQKQKMKKRVQETKETLIKEAGGSCQRCHYNKYPGSLVFHHLDPETKSFGLGERANASIKVLRAEASKCILLCANCHHEKHGGLW